MLDVLLVDDSATARSLLRGILEAEPGIRIAGEARDGAEGVEMACRLQPRVITMDIVMPRMGGLEATRRIMEACPTPIVIVTGSTRARDVLGTMEAMRAGALWVLTKPVGPRGPEFDGAAQEVVRTVRAMADVKVVAQRARLRARVPPVTTAPSPPPPAGAEPATPPAVVAVAASTGGPIALQTVLAGLPPGFPAPILVVQHIAPDFVEGLAAWLRRSSPLPVVLATDGIPLRAGTVYLAPRDAHLGVRGRDAVALARTPPVEGFRPSGSRLFESVAEAFGPGALGMVLTGMGRDGAEGLARLKAGGGFVVAQDEATSVVYGMPKAALDAGVVDAVLPLASIGPSLRRWVHA